MALSIRDGNQTLTTLSTIVVGSAHIPAHSVVSLGSQAITDIAVAVSGVELGPNTISALENISVTFGAGTSVTIGNVVSVTGGLTNLELRASSVTIGGSVSVSNLPVTQTVTFTQASVTFGQASVTFTTPTVTGSVSVLNFPATQTVTFTQASVTFGQAIVSASNINPLLQSVGTDNTADPNLQFMKIGGHQDGSNQTSHIVHVSSGGAMKVDATDSSITFGAITGSVSVSNLPATQTVTFGQAGVTFGTAVVTGSVSILNFPVSVTVGSLPVQLSTTTIGGTAQLNVTLSSAATIGATAPSYASLYGGTDGTTLRGVLTDTSGRQIVKTYPNETTGSFNISGTGNSGTIDCLGYKYIHIFTKSIAGSFTTIPQFSDSDTFNYTFNGVIYSVSGAKFIPSSSLQGGLNVVPACQRYLRFNTSSGGGFWAISYTLTNDSYFSATSNDNQSMGSSGGSLPSSGILILGDGGSNTGKAISVNASNGYVNAFASIQQSGILVSSANPLFVTLQNTGANATAIKTDSSATTQPISGTVTVGNSVTIGAIIGPAGGSCLKGISGSGDAVRSLLFSRDSQGNYGEIQGSGVNVFDLPVYGTVTVGNSVSVSGTVSANINGTVPISAGALGTTSDPNAGTFVGNFSIISLAKYIANLMVIFLDQRNPFVGTLTFSSYSIVASNTNESAYTVTGRKYYLELKNASSNVMYINFSGVAASASTYRLNANEKIVFDKNLVPSGAVQVFGTSGDKLHILAG